MHYSVTTLAFQIKDNLPKHGNFFLSLFFLLYAIFLSVSIFKYSPIPQVLFGHDFIGFLDGMIKVHNGQLQNQDFPSILGPSFFGTLRIGYLISDRKIHYAIPAASLVIALATALLAFSVSISRFSFKASLIFSMTLFVIIQSPFQIYHPATEYSYACVYNRWGSSLLGLLFLVSLFSIKSSPNKYKTNIFAICLSAAITAWLFLLKVSYGFSAFCISVIGLSLLRNPIRTPFRFAMNVCGYIFIATIALLIFGYAYNLSLHSYINDISVALASRQPQSYSDFFVILRDLVLRNAIDGLLFLIMAYLMVTRFNLDRKALKITLISATILTFSLFSDLTNAPNFSIENRETPILAVGGLLLLFYSLRIGSSFPTYFHSLSIERKLSLALISTCAGIIAYPIYAKSIYFSWSLEEKTLYLNDIPQEKFQTGFLKGLSVSNFGGDPPLSMSYVSKVKDGIALLTKNGFASTPVLTFDYTNPLNIGRGIVSPVGSPPFMQYGISFSQSTSPSDMKIFNGSNIIMIAKHFGDGHPLSIKALVSHYADYLSKCYKHIEESDEWILMESICP